MGATKAPKPRLSRRKSFDRSDDILEEDYSDCADHKPKSCHSLKPTSSRRLSLNGSTSSGIMKDQNVKPSRKKSYDQSNDNFEEASDVAAEHKPKSCLSLKSVSSRRLSLDGSALGVMKEQKPKLSRKKSCDGSDEILKEDSATALVDHKPKRRSSLKSIPSRRLSMDDSLIKERISISKRKSLDQSSNAISGDDNSSQKSSSVRRKQRSKPIQMAESSSSLESKEETTRRKTSMNSTASGDKTPKQRRASTKTKSFTVSSSDSIRSASPKSLSATLETEKQSLKNDGRKSSKKDGAKRDGAIKSKKSKSQNGTELNEKISASIQISSKGSKEFEVFKYHQDEKLHQKMMRRRNSCFT